MSSFKRFAGIFAWITLCALTAHSYADGLKFADSPTTETYSRVFTAGVGDQFTSFEPSDAVSRYFTAGTGREFGPFETNEAVSRLFTAGVGGQFQPPVTEEAVSRLFTAGVGSQFLQDDVNDALSRLFTVNIPIPDLIPQSVEDPGTVTAGDIITVQWEVFNATDETAPGDWIDALFLVSEGAAVRGLPTADVTITSDVLGMETYSASLDYTIPENQSPGNYELAVYTNYGGDLFEADFDNNITRSPVFRIDETPLPDLEVISVSSPPDGFALQPVEVSWTVQNVGSLEAQTNWIDRVLAVPADGMGEPITLAEFAGQTGLVPSAMVTRTETVQYPSVDGEYFLAVDTNASGSVSEPAMGGSDNNRGLSDDTFVVDGYTVTASADIEEALSPTPVTITGEARQLSTDTLLPNALVAVSVEVKGSSRILNATTNQDGQYTAVFTPLQREAGIYTVSAGPPDALSDVQDIFALYGARVDSLAAEQITVYTNGATATETIRFFNNGDAPLSGLNAVLELEAGVSGDAMLSSEDLSPNGFVDVTLALQSDQKLLKRKGLASSITLTSTEGVMVTHPFEVDLRSTSADIEVEPGALSVSALRSTETESYQEFHEIILRNEGSLPSSEISVSLPPDEDWISLTTPNPIPPIPAGGSARIGVRIAPGPEQPLSVFNGSIALSGDSITDSIPLTVRIQSTLRGDLAVRVTDEFSYWDEEGGFPNVTGANVQLWDATFSARFGLNQSDQDGIARFEDVREGYYMLLVNSPEHGLARKRVYIEADQETDIEVFISRQLVRYDWTVTPITIEDTYEIDIFATFETFVPAPVVTVEPAYFDLTEIPVGKTQVDFTITNHGLIRADDLQWLFNNTDEIEITPLIQSIGDLEARSSIVVPVVFERLPEGKRVGKSSCKKPGLELNWELLCGAIQNYFQPVGLGPSGAGGSGCGGLRTFRGSGGAAGAGGSWSPPGGAGTPGDCDPCVNDMLEAWLICGLGAIPGPVGCAVGGASCGNDLGSANDGLSAGIAVAGCGASALGCFGGPIGGAVGAAICLGLATEKCGLISDTLGLKNTPSLSAGKRYFLEYIERLQDAQNPIRVTVGNPKWFDETEPDEGQLLFDLLTHWEQSSVGGSLIELKFDTDETTEMLALPRPEALTEADVQLFIDRWNRTMDYYGQNIFEIADVPEGSSTDFIAVSAFQDAVQDWQEAEQAAVDDGFTSILEGAEFAADAFAESAENSPSGVCARVVINISQQLVLSRTAFDATLRLSNDGEASLNNVEVELFLTDADGERAPLDLFSVGDPELTGISELDGSQSLASASSLTASWTLIPTDAAAITGPTQYGIGGTVSYFLDGQLIEIPLFPVTVEVVPNPALELDYFLVRNVYSDDPFTPEIEPAEPFDLGVLVTNTGAGEANNLSIASSQPEIIDNEKGLLINFEILGAQVGNEQVAPTLTANFGNLPAGQSTTARWLMTSSLQGEFIEYEATFEHISPFGNDELSLIDRVDIHPLIRAVRSDATENDGAFDFLADDVADLQDLPDQLYESNGARSDVVSRLDAEMISRKQTNAQKTITIQAPDSAAGNQYLRLESTEFEGYLISSVERSNDGKSLLQWNSWITARTIRLEGEPTRREVRFHLLDYLPEALDGETVQYIITLQPAPIVEEGMAIY